MPFFRKKPVVIEARQFDGSWLCAKPILDWIEDTKPIDQSGPTWVDRDGGQITLWTLEGAMIASPGDWIIKGVKGEFYPCKPDIFAATYEAAEDAVPDGHGDFLSTEIAQFFHITNGARHRGDRFVACGQPEYDRFSRSLLQSQRFEHTHIARAGYPNLMVDMTPVVAVSRESMKPEFRAIATLIPGWGADI